MDGSVVIIAGRDPLPPYAVHANMFICACSCGHARCHASVLNACLNHALGLRGARLEVVRYLSNALNIAGNTLAEYYTMG